MSSLQNCYDIVKANRNELTPSEEEAADPEADADPKDQGASMQKNMISLVLITNRSSYNNIVAFLFSLPHKFDRQVPPVLLPEMHI